MRGLTQEHIAEANGIAGIFAPLSFELHGVPERPKMFFDLVASQHVVKLMAQQHRLAASLVLETKVGQYQQL